MNAANLKDRIRSNFNNWMLGALIIVCVVFFTIMKSSFFSVNSFSSIGKQAPEIGLLTMAMMLPMLVGGIDLSIIASANLAAVLMTLIMAVPKGEPESGPGKIILALFVCIVVCAVVGFFNGLIVAYFKVPAMLVTLGMQMMLRGLALGMTKGGTLSGYPKAFTALGNGITLGIPTQLYIFIAATAVLIIIMNMTALGTKLTMYGSNRVAAVYSGINETTLLIKTYMLSGVYAGLAAIIMTSRLNSASAGTASTYLMRTILIAVLGGVDPNGGSGKVSGVLLSILLYQIVATGLNILKVNAYIVTALFGVILIFAVIVRNRRN